MDLSAKSIQEWQARVASELSKLFRTPVVPYVVAIYIAVHLLKSLSNRLSWYMLNNCVKLDKWNPAKELAVVTGGASGIGWQIVQDLVALNIKVVLLDIQEPKADLRKRDDRTSL